MHCYLISVWLLVSTAPAAIAAKPPSPIAFRDVTKQAGMIEPLAGMLGHGGAWGDVDGDHSAGGSCSSSAATSRCPRFSFRSCSSTFVNRSTTAGC
jgi:hypothetical protein